MKKSFQIALLLITVLSMYAAADIADSKRIESATDVLKDITAIPDKTIPAYLFENAQGVAIIPSVIKGAFGFGGRWGKGVIMVRNEHGGWSDPCFVILRGGSVGWQIGAQSSDIVLIFRSKRSIEGLYKGKFTLGAGASVVAGPVGRDAQASTDIQMRAEIYSYARARGLFAGISIQGANLQIDGDANDRYYRSRDISSATILSGVLKNTPQTALALNKELTDLSFHNRGEGHQMRADTSRAYKDSSWRDRDYDRDQDQDR